MLHPAKASEPTAPTLSPDIFDKTHIQHAILQAKIGLSEGGVPIGAALSGAPRSALMELCWELGETGEYRRQALSVTTDCLENIGRLPAKVYEGSTMFTTLSPCPMCAGAVVLFGIKKVVMGENSTFAGGEGILRERGVEVVNLDLPECKALMAQFIERNPDVWNEDIGES